MAGGAVQVPVASITTIGVLLGLIQEVLSVKDIRNLFLPFVFVLAIPYIITYPYQSLPFAASFPLFRDIGLWTYWKPAEQA